MATDWDALGHAAKLTRRTETLELRTRQPSAGTRPENGSILPGGPDGSLINDEAFVHYRRLGKVRSFVLQHLSCEIRLADAAGVAGNEKCYFSHFFREKVGVTFTSWLRWVRVCAAAGLIRESNEPLSDIGAAAGFQSLSAFERTFKRFTGMTPRDFRKSVRPD